ERGERIIAALADKPRRLQTPPGASIAQNPAVGGGRGDRRVAPQTARPPPGRQPKPPPRCRWRRAL
ncbi:MAG: hypothetical protein ACP5J3_14075, partial [Pyrobaculum sp.]